jgi:transposase-like protein
MEPVLISMPAARPEVHVSSKPTRRQFTAEYKERILREADALEGERGAVGALLRREGLYSSHLAAWRAEARSGLRGRKRGPKPKENTAETKRMRDLEKENSRLAARLERVEALLELQKKVADLMGVALPAAESKETKS